MLADEEGQQLIEKVMFRFIIELVNWCKKKEVPNIRNHVMHIFFLDLTVELGYSIIKAVS